jgi:hypothetical protein
VTAFKRVCFVAEVEMEESDMDHDGFTFDKWYMDCVESEGRAAIAYRATIAWGALAFSWQSVAVYDPRLPPQIRTSFAKVEAPHREGRMIRWKAPDLGCAIEVETRQDPVDIRLLENADGVIEWRCKAPAARVCMQVDGHEPIRGCGYAERLILTVLPWRIPIDELRWGRWIAADASHSPIHSIVWIDWRGELPSTWVFVDGVRQQGATAVVSDDAVSTGGSALTLSAPRVLESRSLDEIVKPVGALKNLLPASLLGLRETKWCSSGTWRSPGAAPLSGWAIHEIVRFR